MREFVRSNYQFLILCFLWIAIGIIAGTVLPAVLFILCSVLLLKYKNLYHEMFLGFLLVLILSDSRYSGFDFAADVKVYYILLLSLFFFFDRNSFPEFNKLALLFLPFLVIAAFLVVLSENWVVSFQKTVSYALLLFIVPNYVVKLYKEQGSVFFKNIIFLFSFVLLAGLILKYTRVDIATLAGRYRGIFGNPNGLGLFCTLYFLLYYVVQEYFPGLFSKAEKAYIYFILIISIYFCSSRNTIMSILCFFIFLKAYKISPYLGFLILFSIIVGYEIIIQNFGFIIRSLGLEEYFRLQTLETGSGRNIAWEFAWKNIQDNFFFGKGFAYDETLFVKSADELSIQGHQGNVHNSYLTIWINTGIFGLFFFMRGFFLAFFKSSKNTKTALPIMFAILFSANFESWMSASLNPVTVQLWIILTILTSQEFNEKENESSVPVH